MKYAIQDLVVEWGRMRCEETDKDTMAATTDTCEDSALTGIVYTSWTAATPAAPGPYTHTHTIII